MHIVHPLIRPEAVEFRGYQANLARLAEREDLLVVLPTGMGKTVVAVLAIADALQRGAQRILVLAPTRPLVEQLGRRLRETLVEPWGTGVRVLTGDTAPAKRRDAYQSGIVVATPQVVQNDVLTGALDASQVHLVLFDEAHRAVGDYPYTFLGQEFQSKAPHARRIGLTASPGHSAERIQEVRTNLGFTRIEIRTALDPDVAPYVQEVQTQWETLPMPPEMARVSQRLDEALADRIRSLRAMGWLKKAGSRPSRRDLLDLQRQLAALIQREANPDSAWFTALSLQAQALKFLHAIEQAQTQGASAFVGFVEGLREEAQAGKPSKATQSFLQDARLNEAYAIARHDKGENPKLGRVGVLVQEELETNPESRIIVFTHYRSTCETVATHLAGLTGVRPVVFVGQQKSGAQKGMSQKDQQETVQAFAAGQHNVLVATSVAEEGLDIPDTDLVVFYEPIPSEIRAIQRRGRTGRKRAGRVVVLMTKGTQDEAAHWVSRRKEQQMVRELQGLRSTLATGPLAQPRAARPSSLDPSNPDAGERSSNAPGQTRLGLGGALPDEEPDARAEPAKPGQPADGEPAHPPTAVTPAAPLPQAAASARPAVPGPLVATSRGALPVAMASATTKPAALAPVVPSAGRRPGSAPSVHHGDQDPSPPSPGAASVHADASQELAPMANPPRILFDLREQGGGVVRHLHLLGASLEPRRLEVGDFILSDRVAVERKSTKDFVDSLVDGRLFDQVRTLKAYPRPLLVVEGVSLAGHRNISGEAIYGALSSIAVDFGVPILQTRDGAETANLLHAIAKREQGPQGRRLAVRAGKHAMPDQERLAYILAGFPGVLDVLAERILTHFGSLGAVFEATASQLAEVEGIGEQKASEIRRLLDLPFRPAKRVEAGVSRRTETV